MRGGVAHAAPTVGDCDPADWPGAFALTCDAANATDRCLIDSMGDVVCFLWDCADGINGATVVHDYNATGNHHFSAWGSLNGSDWCCTIDDDPVNPVIDDVTILGCEAFSGDVLSFQWPRDTVASADNLAPHRTAQLLGFIYGGDGDGVGDKADETWGSDYSGSDYRDSLYGEDGNDVINGGGDSDWIDGGGGDDACYGSGGGDRIVGGAGLDDLFGEDGHDTLCDTDDAAGTHHMDGGNDNDTLWLTDVGAASGWDAASTCAAGNGVERYGHDPAFAPPGTCITPISNQPAECTDPN